MTPDQFADWLTHVGAAEFNKLGIAKPDAAVTRATSAEQSGVRIVVTIARIEHEPYRDMRSDLPPLEPATKPTPILKEIQRCIMEAAPNEDAEPKSMKWLARVSGYACNGHFRGHVAQLIDLGLLVRLTGGIRKAADKAADKAR